MADVILARTADASREKITETVSRVLNSLNYDFPSNISKIVIKPNLCYYWDYSTGQTTDPRVVSAIIDWIRQRISRDVNILVAEADATAMRTKYAFKMLGYEKVSQEKNVSLINLCQGSILNRDVLIDGEKLSLPVSETLLSADLIINVPKIKSHRAIGFSCALKNMFGAIAKPGKYSYHGILSRVIVGINKIVKSDIVLVDGVIVAGKTPKKMGLLATSRDALSSDMVVAQIAGYNPKRIRYLKLAATEKIGDYNSRLVSLDDPVGLARSMKEFPKQNYFLQMLLWNSQLKMLKWYAKIFGDVIPPVLN